MLVSVHLSYILGHLPLRQRFPLARQLGFAAVEYPFPYELEASDYRSLLEDNGLRQISIGAPAADYRKGEPSYSATPALKRQFDDSISRVIDFAKTVKCDNIHVFAGTLAPDVTREAAFETYCSNLAAAYDRLTAEGLTLVVEPVNSTDFKGYFLDRLDFALAAIAHSGRDGVKVVLDVYHAAVNGEDAIAFVRDNPGRVAHIQLADYPGRHEPGEGTIDFARLIEVLGEVGYSGSVGLEYVPTRPITNGVPIKELLGLA